MHRGDCSHHHFVIIFILFIKIIWGHEINLNQQNLEYDDPEDDNPTNNTIFGNVNIKSLFNIPTNFLPLVQQQINKHPNANTTNTPTLTTYPLLLQHLHSTNAFVDKTIKDLSASSLESVEGAASSLNNNQEYQKGKQEKFKNQMTLSSSPHKTKAQPSASAPQKQKLHKTDAPMLNYIFDSHAPNKKHNHNFRFGPHFEEVTPGNITNVTVQHGGTAFLDCKISFLQDKTVSWVRRKHQNNELQLLTVGPHTYTGDSRYTNDFQYPNNWRLKIAYVNKRDEGSYECQISTHPPKVVQTNLFINAPEIWIVDEHDDPLFDKYYEIDSTLQLTCIVRHITMTESVVYWTHNEYLLNYDTMRGGISVKTDLTESGANSTLFVAKVNKSDSGNYTCSIGPTELFTTNVHVLNGESLAELYHGNCRKQFQHYNSNNNINVCILVLWIIKIIFCYTICDGN